MIVPADCADVATVTELLGRPPKTTFEVVARSTSGVPIVIRNAAFELDGTPMPTRYWLLPSAKGSAAIGRLESGGAVRRGERELAPEAIAHAHRLYAADRDSEIPDGWIGPRPIGGVGGTRKGLKCLHAHYAHWLAGADDAVGAWVAAQIPPGELDVRSSGHPRQACSQEREAP